MYVILESVRGKYLIKLDQTRPFLSLDEKTMMRYLHIHFKNYTRKTKLKYKSCSTLLQIQKADTSFDVSAFQLYKNYLGNQDYSRRNLTGKLK